MLGSQCRRYRHRRRYTSSDAARAGAGDALLAGGTGVGVLARRTVRRIRMHTDTGAVALIVRALVAVIDARRARRLEQAGRRAAVAVHVVAIVALLRPFQMPLPQKGVCVGVALGVGVLVGVAVLVGVRVLVAVRVKVAVRVAVGVNVSVGVGVHVGRGGAELASVRALALTTCWRRSPGGSNRWRRSRSPRRRRRSRRRQRAV